MTPREVPGPEALRCADCGQPIASCACDADPLPPEPVPYRGYTIKADARLSVDGGLWAPVLTLRWTRQDTGVEEVREIPNVPR